MGKEDEEVRKEGGKGARGERGGSGARGVKGQEPWGGSSKESLAATYLVDFRRCAEQVVLEEPHPVVYS